MHFPSVAQLTRALKLAQDLEDLKAELASIMGDSSSASLTTKTVKRGRPAGKRGMSEEGRKRIAEAQKKRWAEKKRADGKK